MYKRPTTVRKACVGYSGPGRVSPLASGCRAMNSSVPTAFRKPEWCPPRDHVSYFAALKARGEDTAQYERLTEEFYRKYPPLPPKPEPNLAPIFALANKYYGKGEPPRDELAVAMRDCGVSDEDIMSYTMAAETIVEFEYVGYVKEAVGRSKPKYDYVPMCELADRYYSKGKIPPVPVVTRAMRKAGYSDERIDRYVKWNKRMEETYEQRTEAIDKIFAKWPSASKGPVKKKVIKAVKKNM